MEPIELLLLVAALLIGIGVGTLLARSQRGAEVAELRAMASEARSDLDEEIGRASCRERV